MSSGEKETFLLKNIPFTVDKRYHLEKLLGEGACGVVCAAVDTEDGSNVAVKKARNLFGHPVDAKRALREIKIHAQLQHPNVLTVRDIMGIDEEDADTYDTIYLVTDRMDSDLHRIIQSKQPMTDQHYAFFMYQLLCGLKYIHSAGVIHRDLKPANLLVDASASLKICDFGLARVDVGEEDVSSPSMTAYVVTRWYRAPEVILDHRSYNQKVDLWAAGLILAELLGKQPFLKGRNEMHQIKLILDLVGPPKPETVAAISNRKARAFVENYTFPPGSPKPLASFFPDASPDALDLMAKLLAFDPNDRISAADALEHPYLADFREPEVELASESKFTTFDFERAPLTIPTIRRLIYNEMLRFHPELGDYDGTGDLALTPEERAAVEAALEADDDVVQREAELEAKLDAHADEDGA